MDNTPKYISKIEIKGLWGKYDIDWDLNPDVNVLGGINGSGKSTVLKFLYQILTTKAINATLQGIVNQVLITFNDDKLVVLTVIKIRDISFAELEKRNDDISRHILETSKQNGINIPKNHILDIRLSGMTKEDKSILETFSNTSIINFINTFDEELKSADAIQTLSDKSVRTQLDWQLHQLQKEYLNYQLNISKKLAAISKSQSPNMAVEMQNVQHAQERFLDIMDDLYRATDKKIDRDSNEIALFFGETPLTPYQLSSGEKQILVILLTVLVQNNQPAVLIMDEPEISLHIDWQEKLIAYIRELNPNVQVIIATHSPGIIIDGWQDKVTEMSDIKHEILKIAQ